MFAQCNLERTSAAGGYTINVCGCVRYIHTLRYYTHKFEYECPLVHMHNLSCKSQANHCEVFSDWNDPWRANRVCHIGRQNPSRVRTIQDKMRQKQAFKSQNVWVKGSMGIYILDILYAYLYIYHIFRCRFLYVHVYTYICIYTHTCAYMYVCMYIYIYIICMRAYTNNNLWSLRSLTNCHRQLSGAQAMWGRRCPRARAKSPKGLESILNLERFIIIEYTWSDLPSPLPSHLPSPLTVFLLRSVILTLVWTSFSSHGATGGVSSGAAF